MWRRSCSLSVHKIGHKATKLWLEVCVIYAKCGTIVNTIRQLKFGNVYRKNGLKVYKKLSEKTLISHPCKHRKQSFNYSFFGIPIMAYRDKRGRYSKQFSTNISNRRNRNILSEHNYLNIFDCDGDECVNTRCNADRHINCA